MVKYFSSFLQKRIGKNFVFLITGSLQNLFPYFRKGRIYIDIMVITKITILSDLF